MVISGQVVSVTITTTSEGDATEQTSTATGWCIVEALVNGVATRLSFMLPTGASVYVGQGVTTVFDEGIPPAGSVIVTVPDSTGTTVVGAVGTVGP